MKSDDMISEAKNWLDSLKAVKVLTQAEELIKLREKESQTNIRFASCVCGVVFPRDIEVPLTIKVSE